MSDHDVERFNLWGATYDRHYLQRLIFWPVQKTILGAAREEAPDPRAILDVGCGTGRLLMAAEQTFPNARLEGVDAAGAMVRHAQAVLPPSSRITFPEATAERLPFHDAPLDLAFSPLTFPHSSHQPPPP